MSLQICPLQVHPQPVLEPSRKTMAKVRRTQHSESVSLHKQRLTDALAKITFTGLSLVFINFFTMILFDPKYLTTKEGAAGPPQWIFYT